MQQKLIGRLRAKYRRTVATRFGRRCVRLENKNPVISFTFDDAPRSAFEAGADILRSVGARGTFFVSLGLLGARTEVGPIATAEDLSAALEEGHELGCHTFDHLDAWYTPTDAFLSSVDRNGEALAGLFPGQRFKTFAYPKSGAELRAKHHLEARFTCCRGGGQIANVDAVDLNLVNACFLDRRTNISLGDVRGLIDLCVKKRGWLVFATHDISGDPSPYGCTRDFLREVLRYSAESGAVVLPFHRGCEVVSAGARGESAPQ